MTIKFAGSSLVSNAPRSPQLVFMTAEHLKDSESRVRRLVELRWQREVIARWIVGFGTPVERQSQLEEMLAQVNAELQALEGPPASGDGNARAEQAD
jgi:hypothetical protein